MDMAPELWQQPFFMKDPLTVNPCLIREDCKDCEVCTVSSLLVQDNMRLVCKATNLLFTDQQPEYFFRSRWSEG